MATKKKRRTSGTSFIVRSISGQDRAVLDQIKRRMGERTDSKALARLLTDHARTLDRMHEAEAARDEMERKLAAVAAAMDKRAEADQELSDARAALGDVANAAFIREQVSGGR